MAQTASGSFKDFFEENLQFTPSAARWVIALSVLGILKSVLLLLIPIHPAVIYILPPILQLILPAYIVTFIYFRANGSQYASVSFARGLANLIPMILFPLIVHGRALGRGQYLLFALSGPLLSMVLIAYVLGTKRVETVASGKSTPDGRPIASEPYTPQWKAFFRPALLSLAALVIAAIIALLVSKTFDPSATPVRAAGATIFALSLLGIVIHFIGALSFALRRNRPYALGCVLSLFMMCFTGFFGCCAMFAGTSWH